MSRLEICIENERLLIHDLSETDLDALAEMRNDPEIYRYEPSFLAERQGTPEEALQVLRNMDLLKDRQCILGIYEKEEPEVLRGLAELYDYKPSGKVISIGYRLRKEYWGRGIGSACLRLLLDYLYRHTETELVTAHVIPDNQASARVLKKNGFEYLFSKTEDWGHETLTEADVYTLDLLRQL